MTYRIALERLRAYEPKRLAMGAYWDTVAHCHCAIGALVPGLEPYREEVIAKLILGKSSVKQAIAALDLTKREAIDLQFNNDAFDGTHEERYAHVLAWLETQVAREGNDHG